MPGGSDRTADLVAAFDTVAGEPTLLIFAFQSRHDPDKLDVTREEAAILRGRVRHGEDRKGKYAVLTALISLRGRCPVTVLEMTVPGGFGTWHAPLIWNIADDSAGSTLEAVSAGTILWGMLFRIPLMTGGDDPAVISRWRYAVTHVVSDHRIRGDLAGVALVFAELANRKALWKKGLEGFAMTESEVVNQWIHHGRDQERYHLLRNKILRLLMIRFSGDVYREK